MINNKTYQLFVVFSILLAACAGPASASADAPIAQNNTTQSSMDAVQSVPSAESTPTASVSTAIADTHGDAIHHSDVDLTRLEVGDGKYSTSPQAGYVYSCMTSFNGGGASGTGSWMNGDGTWDATKKAVVDGSVT